jgi:hypothetical protein
MEGRGRVLFQHPLMVIASKYEGDTRTRIFSEIVAGALVEVDAAYLLYRSHVLPFT